MATKTEVMERNALPRWNPRIRHYMLHVCCGGGGGEGGAVAVEAEFGILRSVAAAFAGRV